MKLPNDFRQRLQEVLECPTAPFREGAVHAVLLAAATEIPGVRSRVDEHGNLELLYGRGRPPLLFACHTDHPALESNGDGTARIVGGIRAAALTGATLRGFPPHGPTARVLRPVGRIKDLPRSGGEVRLKGGRRFPKGTPLILDLPGIRITGRKIRARAIDDGCAVAACLTTLDRLRAARFSGRIGFLFTRAEEVGFAGALGWVRSTGHSRRTTVVNLEMSNALRHTPLGSGPILRIGDRITTFDSSVSLGLERTARRLQERDSAFRYQRALMDGGACEATVYAHAGFPTGALCLPLRNYHNHTPSGGMGHEYVDQQDAANLVRWMVAYARGFERLNATARLDRELGKLWRRHRARLRRTAHEGGGQGG